LLLKLFFSADRAKSHERFGDRPFKPRGDRVNASGGATTGFRRRNNFNSAGLFYFFT